MNYVYRIIEQKIVDSVSEGGNGNGWLDQTRLEEKEDPIEKGTRPEERKTFTIYIFHRTVILSVKKS